jgi:ABC-type transport system involved in cytochrome c biogenesis permease subunit
VVELTSNQVEIVFLFWLAVASGGAGALLYIKNFFAKIEKPFQQQIASFFTFISVFSLTLILIFNWLNLRLHPFAGAFSIRLFFALTVMAVYLALELIYSKISPKIRYLGMFALPISVIIMLFAWSAFEVPASIPTPLKSFSLFIHVSAALIAYGSFTVATFLAFIYLLQESQLRRKSLNPIWRRFPSLETADQACYRAVVVGEFFTVVLILIGMVWAKVVWGRMWQWDPKQVGALAMLILYGLYIVARTFWGWRGKKASYLAIIGAIAAVITYFINYFLPSIHTYGKGF